jgi:hypothetical protein
LACFVLALCPTALQRSRVMMIDDGSYEGGSAVKRESIPFKTWSLHNQG